MSEGGWKKERLINARRAGSSVLYNLFPEEDDNVVEMNTSRSLIDFCRECIASDPIKSASIPSLFSAPV